MFHSVTHFADVFQFNTHFDGGVGPSERALSLGRVRKKFFIFIQNANNNLLQLQNQNPSAIFMSMFESLPYEPREIAATEARLQRIYDAAALGLKGDSLALAAGMLPTEYRRLCQMDPMAEMAELKGRADSELKTSKTLHKAAEEGDAKAALEILKHNHGWTAKQEITVDVYQRISITQALADAKNRVIEGTVVNGPDATLQLGRRANLNGDLVVAETR